MQSVFFAATSQASNYIWCDIDADMETENIKTHECGNISLITCRQYCDIDKIFYPPCVPIKWYHVAAKRKPPANTHNIYMLRALVIQQLDQYIRCVEWEISQCMSKKQHMLQNSNIGKCARILWHNNRQMISLPVYTKHTMLAICIATRCVRTFQYIYMHEYMRHYYLTDGTTFSEPQPHHWANHQLWYKSRHQKFDLEYHGHDTNIAFALVMLQLKHNVAEYCQKISDQAARYERMRANIPRACSKYLRKTCYSDVQIYKLSDNVDAFRANKFYMFLHAQCRKIIPQRHRQNFDMCRFIDQGGITEIYQIANNTCPSYPMAHKITASIEKYVAKNDIASELRKLCDIVDAMQELSIIADCTKPRDARQAAQFADLMMYYRNLSSLSYDVICQAIESCKIAEYIIFYFGCRKKSAR